MRIAVRLWLLGAVVPVAAVVLALLVAGGLFRDRLEESLDRALLSQAASESVSLFDAPGNRPHLHIGESALSAQVRAFAPAGTIFGPDGGVVVRYPPVEGAPPEKVLPGTPGAPPVLSTRRGPSGEPERLIRLTVAAPSGALHTLQLVASTAQIHASEHAFERVTLVVAVVLGAILLLVQGWQARRLTARVGLLTSHMAALREGHLEASPPSDETTDEIGELSQVVAEATRRLRAARAAQERLIAEAAHELRTPLGLMRTGFDLALRRPRDAGELAATLEEGRREVDRLAALAARLLDMAAVGRGSWDRAPGDLRDPVREGVEASRAEAETAGVVVLLEAPERVPARFHAGSIRQAIDNLLSNAVKFSPRGGTVLVSVSRRAGMARIAVRDEGPGIPVSDRERIFEPFHRSGAPGQAGAGLGLAVVREIARSHGGRVEVASGPGKGAELVLEVPCENGNGRK